MVKQAKYSVIKKLNNIEIRLYNPLILAKVDGFGDSGFNFLFNYISGNNIGQTDLEMTSPVISQSIKMTAPVLSEQDSIAFVIPEKFTINEVPKPRDARIKIQQIPQRYVAVLKFSGRWVSENFNKKSKQLLEELDRLDIKTKGKLFSMRYNGPLTPWFLRRNEVAIEVESDFKIVS